MMLYKYGLRHRPYGLGHQPKGFYTAVDAADGDKYWSYVWYTEPLTAAQVYDYELDYLGAETA